MYDEFILKTASALSTRSAGASLAHTLYGLPVTIGLMGELGAGKTTFLQGFAEALGVAGNVQSPTYALEQRYATSRGELLHLDLYRLTQRDAAILLASTDDHAGVRVVEWWERSQNAPCDIAIEITEGASHDERNIRCTFRDETILKESEIEGWRHAVHLPSHIVEHCDAVADAARALADIVRKRGMLVRDETLHQAGRMHDLFRFLDFRPGANPEGFIERPEDLAAWASWTDRYRGMRHEAACAAFLREHGHAVLAAIVATHGLQLPPADHGTTEQKLLYYADKRVCESTPVTLEKRFADFSNRYAKGALTPDQMQWLEEAKKIEKELFPEGAPIL